MLKTKTFLDIFKGISFAVLLVCLFQNGVFSFNNRLHFKTSLWRSLPLADRNFLKMSTIKDLPLAYSPSPSISTEIDMKLGVLLLNLGGPETMKDVEGFLYNLFADPDIIRLPSLLQFAQKPLAYFIAKRRAPKSSEAYASIGGGSPIVKYTQAQADLIKADLSKRGFKDPKCYFAMRYWNPYTEEVLDQIRNDGINTLVIMPLYPHYSISTSGSSLRLLQEIFAKNPEIWGNDKVLHTVVPAWYYRKGYIATVAKLILEELSSFTPEQRSAHDMHILFSAHGVPQSYIIAGDPYQRQIEECVRLVAKEVSSLLQNPSTRPKGIPENEALRLAGAMNVSADFKPLPAEDALKPQATLVSPIRQTTNPGEISFHLSFQSRVGPVQWLQPYTEETLEHLGQSGVKNLIVVPISFVSEHIETLEEIDMEYRELAESNGVENWRRVPALNTNDNFIEDLAQLVVDSLEAPAVSLIEAVCTQHSEISLVSPEVIYGSRGENPTSERLQMLAGSYEDSDSLYDYPPRKEKLATSYSTVASNTSPSNNWFDKILNVFRDKSNTDPSSTSLSSSASSSSSSSSPSSSTSEPLLSLPFAASVVDSSSSLSSPNPNPTFVGSVSEGNKIKNDNLSKGEQVNGRVAMLGILSVTLIELFTGHPLVQMFGIAAAFK